MPEESSALDRGGDPAGRPQGLKRWLSGKSGLAEHPHSGFISTSNSSSEIQYPLLASWVTGHAHGRHALIHINI